MSSKQLKIALVNSVAAHLMVIITLFFGVSFWHSPNEEGGKGSGDVIGVWVKEISSPSTEAPKSKKNEGPVVKRENHINANSSTPIDNGTGSGVGIGTGTGTGAGIGSDSTLTTIWKQINASKFYPQTAKKQKLEGIPKITFEIDSNGKIKWVNIATSSGEKILDDAAVETVKRAAPLPFYPKPVTVAVRYSLKDSR